MLQARHVEEKNETPACSTPTGWLPDTREGGGSLLHNKEDEIPVRWRPTSWLTDAA